MKLLFWATSLKRSWTSFAELTAKPPITAAIAKRLIDLAIAGVSDPQRLKALTIQAFRGMPPQNSAVSLPEGFPSQQR
jgi:hypothetical protein